MKKTTFKGILCLLFAFSILAVNAQQKKQIKLSENNITNIKSVKPKKSKTQTNIVDDATLQLTPENQKSLQETGFVRCATVEMENLRRQNNPNLQTPDEFENWLAPLIQERKERIAQQRANGTYRMAVVTIPIIFHVITDGTGDTNLSAAQIQAQIDQLNLDFSNQAGSTHPDAADAQIVFEPALRDPDGNDLAEPGIDRVTTYGGGTQTSNYYDSTIKPNTIWDRNYYANIWTGNLGGGLLGYAQFPYNSTLPGMGSATDDPQTDGVVCLYTSIGSVANPHPDGGVYAAGRTLTHELGHWIGLRHIWGDANCGNDYCDDTPQSTTSNSGCPTQTTCDGTQDMVENYMDYTYDTCMNIFTYDQVNRMVTVLENADGFDTLQNSDVAAPSAPIISFASTTGNTNEGSDCSYTDLVLPVNIGLGPSTAATATFTASGGTATAGSDYSLLTTTVSFAQGATASQDIVLRVFNDSFIEGDETVTIDFTVNANGGDAVAGNNSLTFTINDDDLNPLTSGPDIAIFTDDFESGLGQWTVTGPGSGTNFAIADDGTFPDAGYFSTDGTNTTNYVFINDDDCNCTMDDERMVSPTIDLTSVTSATVQFDYAFSNTYGGVATLQLSTDGGATWPAAANLATTATGDESNIPFATVTIPLDDFIGEIVNLSIHFDDEGGWAGGLIVDNFLVTIPGPAAVQTAVNTGTTNDQLSLPGTGTVFSSDASTNDIMIGITNNNTFDYGCIDASVNRAGTSAQSYNTSITPNLVMDKTFLVTPTNTTTSGNNTVTFYFTEAEISGWENATGLSRNNLSALRNATGEISTLTVGAFGSDVTLTGDFTGLDGEFFFGPEDAFRVLLSPKVFLQGAALNPNSSEESLMRDDLRVQGIIPTTSPYVDALSCSASIFNTTGANAIVDWVWVELRDATTNTTVVASQSALLQRDGDIVALDGVSSLIFNIPSKDYYVVINHRNHLGIMTNSLLTLTSVVSLLDFTDATNDITYGTNAQTVFGMPTDVLGMWAGDVNNNDQVRYLGPSNDTNSIKTAVINHSGNTSGSNFYPYTEYDNADLDLNGQVRYLGPGNDTNTLKSIILAHPDNTSSSNFFPFSQQF